MELDWDVFFGEWEPIIRGWVIAFGGGIALFFATRTYLMNARSKREAQARLVYAKQRGSDPAEGGRYRLYSGRVADPKLATRIQGISTVLVEDAAELEFEVVNGSDELVGPLELTVFHAYAEDDVVRLTLTDEVLEPASRTKLVAVVRDVVPVATHFVLRFRDSSGLWWQRRGMHPIEHLGRRGDAIDEYPVDMRG